MGLSTLPIFNRQAALTRPEELSYKVVNIEATQVRTVGFTFLTLLILSLLITFTHHSTFIEILLLFISVKLINQ